MPNEPDGLRRSFRPGRATSGHDLEGSRKYSVERGKVEAVPAEIGPRPVHEAIPLDKTSFGRGIREKVDDGQRRLLSTEFILIPIMSLIVRYPPVNNRARILILACQRHHTNGHANVV